MFDIGIGFIFSAFTAGVLMFLAPCTLPLVPAYLGFISGVSTKELEDKDKGAAVRKRVFFNGLFFVLGFSVIFILFGVFAGIFGGSIGDFRIWLGRIGGVLVVLFGLSMLGIFKLPFFSRGAAFRIPAFLQVGKFSSSFIIGAAFAFGWTPCVGPILASILLLASTKASALMGGLLLAIFSLGLAVPFILISLAMGSAAKKIDALFSFLKTYRVPLLAFFGFLLGFLLNVLLLVFFAKFGNPSWFEPFSTFVLMIPLATPIVLGGILGFVAYKKETIDVLGVSGGLFLVALGLLLATNSFEALLAYSFALLDFLPYQDILLEYL